MAKFAFNPVSNKFTPTIGKEYYSINGNYLVINRVWNGHEIDKQRLRHNNVFGTLKEAKAVRAKMVDALKAAQAR